MFGISADSFIATTGFGVLVAGSALETEGNLPDKELPLVGVIKFTECMQQKRAVRQVEKQISTKYDE